MFSCVGGKKNEILCIPENDTLKQWFLFCPHGPATSVNIAGPPKEAGLSVIIAALTKQTPVELVQLKGLTSESHESDSTSTFAILVAGLSNIYNAENILYFLNFRWLQKVHESERLVIN